MLQYMKILMEFKNVLLKQEGATWTSILNARPQKFNFFTMVHRCRLKTQDFLVI